jgi:hypothetical protein
MIQMLLPLLILFGCGQENGITKKLGQILVTPTLSDLGPIAPGDSENFWISIENVSGGVLSVESITVNNLQGAAFSDPVHTDIILDEGEGTSIEMAFMPLEAGFHYAEVVVVSDASAEVVTVEVRGESQVPIIEVWPALLDFGPVEAGSVGYASVSLANEGIVPVSLLGASIINSQFGLLNDIETVVLPGEVHVVDLTFMPVDDTAQDGLMTPTLALGVSAPSVILVGNNCALGAPDLYDVDDDGFTSCGGDCDDTDASINPAGTEVYDGVDEDCDGIVDEGTEGYDDDLDGYTELEGDCNDETNTISPGMNELPSNGIDDDCDGVVDDGEIDMDGDGYSGIGGDCDDADASVHPGAPETENGVDEDCDGIVDEGTDAYDDDGDGYSENDGDCDDTNASNSPDSVEWADWVDNDCDGVIDEGTEHYDDDGDGFSEVGGDCDDANPDVSPAQFEVAGDGIDNDCDGVAL